MRTHAFLPSIVTHDIFLLRKVMKMFKNQPIGVFDSGVGGLTVLESLMEAFPNDDFIYIADHGHCPYGIKQPEEIINRVEILGKYLLSKNVKAIVIACNTASLFVDHLRSMTNILVLSVIQPTVNYALLTTKNNRIGVIGTIATIKAGIYQQAIENQNVYSHGIACSEFVDIIENDEISHPKTNEMVKTKLSPFQSLDIDTLIYGCTHFSILEEQIKAVLGPINYISCGYPTSLELLKYLSPTKIKRKRNIYIYTTGKVDKLSYNMKWFKKEHLPIQKLDI